MLGQTVCLAPVEQVGTRASMEGRAIARPNADRRELIALAFAASMEGRAIARPNALARSIRADTGQGASMEGRAIARPNMNGSSTTSLRKVCFNGGPSNCSAKLEDVSNGEVRAVASMEGRAIARPNRRPQPGLDVVSERASMEGRAIARPNISVSVDRTSDQSASMEGRAIARPNLPESESPPSPDGEGFNGGPSNCSAKLGPAHDDPAPPSQASMEGRAIARPNEGFTAFSGPQGSGLQWRAEQLLGQTQRARWFGLCLTQRFNGGPSNCSAKRCGWWGCGRGRSPGFNGGPSNCSAKLGPTRILKTPNVYASMEGRAIARPNPAHDDPSPSLSLRASMEGRAIARPNPTGGNAGDTHIQVLQWRAEQLLGQTGAARRTGHTRLVRFNGGPSNCSAKRKNVPTARTLAGNASMEGRAIARPNRATERIVRRRSQPLQWRAEQLLGQTPPAQMGIIPAGAGFNGGPSNCSAKRRRPQLPTRRFPSRLQWRAEQLLGQTARRRPPSPLGAQASMEGRAIARPNRERHANGAQLGELQWRAEQLLGQTCSRPPRSKPCNVLQWRAEQLLGQTLRRREPGALQACFNGGPSNCSAKRAILGHRLHVHHVASMEGRAIARPNQHVVARVEVEGVPASMEGRAIARPNFFAFGLDTGPKFMLQWRAEQLLGQTRWRRPRAAPR